MKKRIWLNLSLVSGILAVVFASFALRSSVNAGSCADASDAPLVEMGSWEAGESIPTPRSEVKAAALDGVIYVAAGLLSQFEPSDAFYALDAETNLWREAAPLPEARHHVGMAALDDRIYVSGGYGPRSNWTPDIASLWVYDPVEDAWSALAEMPTPRAGHEMLALDGLIYVVGGAGPDPTPLLVYDPSADSWEMRAPMPNPSDHLAAVAFEGSLYAVGGRWSAGNIGTLQVYDPAADRWTLKAEMPTARSGFTAGIIDGRIHTTGGEALDSTCTYSQHEVYDPESDTWERLPDLPESRHGIASAVVDERWYVIGGATGAGGQTGATLSDAVDIFAFDSSP